MKVRNITMALSILVAPASAETNYDDAAAIIAELTKLSRECAQLEAGQSKTEIFDIEMIRVGDTCAIVKADEFDERLRVFLEEQNLPWAGVGVWVTASGMQD